jgi:hypothetical protein
VHFCSREAGCSLAGKTAPYAKYGAFNEQRKEIIMKRITFTIVLILFLSFLAAPVFSEEMAKEGSGTAKAYYTGTYQMLPMAKERAQINYEAYGVIVSDSGKGILHNASAHVMGASHVVKGVIQETGFAVYTRPDGDKAFMTYKVAGKMGQPVKGEAVLVGGTGKLAGIQGNGEFTRYQLRPPAEGKMASFSVSKMQWKIVEPK